MTIRSCQLIFFAAPVFVLVTHGLPARESAVGSGAPGGAATQPQKVIKNSQIREWLKQLGAPNFRQREVAALKLKKAGPAAAVALIQAVDSSDLEVSLRARQVLAHLLKLYDPPADNIAIETLSLLTRDQSPSIYKWALKALARRHWNSDQSKRPVRVQELLEKLANSNNKEVKNIALEIVYPIPMTFETVERVKRIVVWEQKIRRCEQEIADIIAGENKNRQGQQRVNSLRDYVRSLNAELAGYCEDSFLKYRIRYKKKHGRKETTNPAFYQRDHLAADYSTRRILIAKAIAEKTIKLWRRKVMKRKSADIPEATRKYHIGGLQKEIEYFDKHLRLLTMELRERRVIQSKAIKNGD